jgi:hypothetical protein
MCRVSDPRHFNVDPDPAFHFNADPDPAPHENEANLRPLATRPSKPPFWASTDLHGSIWSLNISCILTLMRIRIQLPKTMWIRIRNPDYVWITSKNPQFKEQKIPARKRGRSQVYVEKSSKILISVFGEKPARGLPKPRPTQPRWDSAEFTRGENAISGREIQTRNWDSEKREGGRK